MKKEDILSCDIDDMKKKESKLNIEEALRLIVIAIFALKKLHYNDINFVLIPKNECLKLMQDELLKSGNNEIKTEIMIDIEKADCNMIMIISNKIDQSTRFLTIGYYNFGEFINAMVTIADEIIKHNNIANLTDKSIKH